MSQLLSSLESLKRPLRADAALRRMARLIHSGGTRQVSPAVADNRTKDTSVPSTAERPAAPIPPSAPNLEPAPALRLAPGPDQLAGPALPTTQRLDLDALAARGGPCIEEPSTSPADRLLAGLLKQFPVADSLVLGWIGLEEHEQATDMLLNLSVRLAARDHGNVGLVDADDRRKSLTRRCGLRDHGGAAEMLCGRQPLAQTAIATSAARLWIVPAGRQRLHLDGLAAAPDLLQTMREAFRFSILDLGACNGPLALEVAAQCDAVYLFVRLGRTPRADLTMRADELRGLGVPVRGCAVVSLHRTG